MKSRIFGAALLSLGMALPATAATINLVSDRDQSGTYNMALTYGSALTVTGLSNRDGTTEIMDDWVGTWSGGLGVEWRDSPEHALNNANNDFDMLLFTFDQAVSLNNISVGWRGDDSDVSVLALTGTEGSYADWAGLLSAGWSHIGNYSNVGSGGTSVNAGNVAANKWLIGAYNPVFGNNWSANNEAFKLKTVSYTPAPADVTAPSTLVTLLVGMIALVVTRRRAKIS